MIYNVTIAIWVFAIFIRRVLGKKIIITKKKIILTICFGIMVYLLFFNLFDLVLLKSLKNIQ